MEEALAAFDRLIEIVPNDPDAWNFKGLTLLETNKEVEALDCFERALEINSQLAHVWCNKGMAYSQLADTQNNGGMTFTALTNYQNAVCALDRGGLAIEFDQDIKEIRDQIQSSIQ
ncbi:tetratricopeptide repeat protein [Methanoculleus chikugoensis]|uniref:tetratricopeptide repeat protein n=1 Tax=Methanoculleus chikugoensis TaxID=118126 RepID=UPI001FB3A116|nr:tetratricopeptide repeat protein [Methanoculleus chikugoensis]